VSYEDFVIQIGPDVGGGYAVSVVKSPAGEGAGSMKIPFDSAEIGQVLENLSGVVRGGQDVVNGTADGSRHVSPLPTGALRHTPREVGAALFRALFSEQVRSLFDQSLGKTRGDADGGLRIQIKLNPEHPDLARLYSLPWELLYRPETQDFLSLSRSSPIVRYLDVSRPTTPYPLPSPLRILVAMASPAGLEPLDFQRERLNIETAWGRQKSVEVVFLPHASPGAIREELLERPCHVLHFMGHGGFERRSGEGVLYLEGESGAPLSVSGHVLAAKLKDFRSLRLVFLNACETARAAGEAGINPFAGVATALILGGIPGVLAMQFPISDEAAIAFSRTFYRRLAAGDPVDTATTEGRQAVHSDNAASIEWATPVLFLRTADGNLFTRASETGVGVGASGGQARASGPAGNRPSLLLGNSGRSGTSLLGAGSAARPRGSGWKKALAALMAATVLTVAAAWLARSGLLGGSEGQGPIPAGEGSQDPEHVQGADSLANGVGGSHTDAPGFPGITIRRAEPRPMMVLEVNEPFRSSIEGFSGMVSKVELRDDRMRWYFHFFNQTDEDRELGFKYGEVYLADEAGNAYRVLEAEAAPSAKGSYGWTVQVGLRLDRWMDFPAPEGSAARFTVGLVPRFSFPDRPEFRPFQIVLPR
jgi:hypothetical protein